MDGVVTCGSVPTFTFIDGIPLRFGALEEDISQPATVIKRTAPDRGHATADGDGGQPATIIERAPSDGGHATADGDGGQPTTVIERTV